MALTNRKIQSPGFEINEIDRSSYDTIDRALVGTTTFVMGFADKGDDYDIKWINSKQTLQSIYGLPENEAEKYFYNAGLEILNRGGYLLMSKLPYNNESKDKYSYVDYKVDINNLITNDPTINNLSSVDATLTSYINIENTELISGLMTNEEYDRVIVERNFGTSKSNIIRIVDETRSQYDTIELPYDGNFISSIECVGVLPVITTAKNAIAFQGLIPALSSVFGDKDDDVKTQNIEKYNAIKYLRTRDSDINIDLIDKDNFSIKPSSDYIYDETISKIAADRFPYISFNSENFLDRSYLKQIGVVVFLATIDSGDNKNLTFIPVESFIGSLDKNAKDKNTNKTLFIDTIVNTNSQYIKLYSNITTSNKNYTDASFLGINNQTATILGFKKSECKKIITYKESILEPMTKIFDNATDPNQIPIDIVMDAGITNIAAISKVARYTDYSSGIGIQYNGIMDFNPSDEYISNLTISDTYKVWRAIAQKITDFCNLRKDCLFVMDGIRQFCLSGNEKILRKTTPDNTVSKTILPNLKYMSGINSSFAAGYCNWFWTIDDYTGDYFWMPPSIKSASAMIYTDTYARPWFAPAGFQRGITEDVVDLAFNTTNEDETGKLYTQSWNYAINYPLNGVIIEGQKTMQRNKTAFDRINVRRMFIYLRKEVIRIARRFNYMQNTEYNRQRLVDALSPIFEDAMNGGGINEYVIKCDEENNTPSVIDNNELRIAIAIKPVKCAEFIILNFICTSQSANVQEEVLSNY